eukprot:gene21959-7288_t
MPDGKVRVMVHTGPGWDGALIIEAPTYKGPYTVVTDADLDDCTSTYCEEDPF